MLIRPFLDGGYGEHTQTVYHVTPMGRVRVDSVACVGTTILKESHSGFMFSDDRFLIQNSFRSSTDVKENELLFVENSLSSDLSYRFGEGEVHPWILDPTRMHSILHTTENVLRTFSLSSSTTLDWLPDAFEDTFELPFAHVLGPLAVYFSFTHLLSPIAFDVIFDGKQGWNVVRSRMSKTPLYLTHSRYELVEFLKMFDHVSKLVSKSLHEWKRDVQFYILVRPFEVFIRMRDKTLRKDFNLVLNASDHCHILEAYAGNKRSLVFDTVLLALPYSTKEVIV